MAQGQFVSGETVQSGVRTTTTANQILRGHGCVKDNATVPNGVKRADADNQAGCVGVALYDDNGADTEVAMATAGVVMMKSSGTIAAGVVVVLSSGGGFKAGAAGNVNTIGTTVEASLSGDLCPVRLRLGTEAT